MLGLGTSEPAKLHLVTVAADGGGGRGGLALDAAQQQHSPSPVMAAVAAGDYDTPTSGCGLVPLRSKLGEAASPSAISLATATTDRHRSDTTDDEESSEEEEDEGAPEELPYHQGHAAWPGPPGMFLPSSHAAPGGAGPPLLSAPVHQGPPPGVFFPGAPPPPSAAAAAAMTAAAYASLAASCY